MTDGRTIAKIIEIGMGEAGFTKAPSVLLSRGLGSCVAIMLYEEDRKIGAMAHVMLPDSREFTGRGELYQFVDLALASMVMFFLNKGVDAGYIIAKIAGGASMFLEENGSREPIGPRIVSAAREGLKAMKIPLVSESVGDNYGRNVRFYLETGRVVVEALGRPDREI